MIISKRRVAAVFQRFPFALEILHGLVRLTRPHFTEGVVAILFNPLGEVLIVEHVYHAHPSWGLPGGYVDRGEDPKAAVERELREELQIDAEAVRVVHIERVIPTHLDIAFLCRTSGTVGQLCGELLAYRWVPADDLPDDLWPFHKTAIREALALLDVSA